MKKAFSAVSVFPSLLIASSVAFASDGAVMQLSDVSDGVKSIMQEQKDFPNQPGQHPGQFPGQPGQHPGQPGQPNQPGHPNQPNQPNQPPQPGQPTQPVTPPVDTSAARRDGMRDGAEKGMREGRREGYSDGLRDGEREGRMRGTSEGDVAGRQAGYKEGYTVDQSAGTQKGDYDGQNAGISNGTAAGQKRCYDEGYTQAYNPAFAEAKKLGQQDAASYASGYANGQSDAAVIEADKGQKAGYQAGFSQRELELQNSPLAASRGMGHSTGLTTGIPIELARNGYATPEERRAYEEGFNEGYRNAYRRSYEDAKRQGYNERFTSSYRMAYDSQFSISYRNGYTAGKEKGYQDAYNSAYNSSYNEYYDQYSGREYADKRAQGIVNGNAEGQKNGFAAGCAEQTRRGYADGYQKKAAEVYPGAFAAGQQAGIAAADKYYSENSVLKVSGVTFYDENGNGKFEASENVMMRAEVSNFGYQKSETLAITVKSERGEITLLPDLKAVGVSGRSKSVVSFPVGKLYDVVAPDADALNVTFVEKGKQVGEARQMYTRTNANKVAVVAEDEADVTKKATWFFPGKITTLHRGDKVIVIGQDGSYYKVRKSEVAGGSWGEGFLKSDKVTLQ